MTSKSASLVWFGGFSFDTATCRLYRGDFEVHLTPKTATVLCCLLRRPGDLITKDEFLSNVWNGVHVREECLTQAISAIRRATGDTSVDPEYIQTVPGEGYRFVGVVTQGPQEIKADGRPPSPPATIAPLTASGTDNDSGATDREGRFLRTVKQIQPGVPTSEIRALAVMPLRLVATDSALSCLSTGITDLLTAELGRIAGLDVTAPSMSHHYQAIGKPIFEVARVLRLDAVVEGSVLCVDDDVRITVFLVDGESGIHSWSSSYVRALRDSMAMQAEIAKEIASDIEGLMNSNGAGHSVVPPATFN